MNRLFLAGLLALVPLAVPGTAWGQFYARPQTSPYYRPNFAPYLGYSGTGPFGAGLIAPYAAGGFGGQAFGPGLMNQPLVAGTVSPTQAAALAALVQQGTASSTNIADPNVTGHPVRFQSYSQYFLNLSATAGNSATAQAQPTQTLPGNASRAQPVVGTRPPRGRGNTGQSR